MKLTKNFHLEEFTRSQTAARHGIDNYPPPEILERIKTILAPGMETVRSAIDDNIITSTSGYRSPALNKIIPGSSDTSAHTQGYADDFIAPSFGTPKQICERLVERGIKFDQLIYEYGEWVHISFDPRMRQQVLSKHKGEPYREGLKEKGEA